MSARPTLRLGTRGSELARTQSGTIAAALERLGLAVELSIIKTSGDQNTTARVRLDRPARRVRPRDRASARRGARRPRRALVQGSADEVAGQLTIAAVPAASIPPICCSYATTPSPARPATGCRSTGARVGTASARRRVWLTHFRPDLVIEPLRGNVPTRVAGSRKAASTRSCSPRPASSACKPSNVSAARSRRRRAASRPPTLRAGAGARRARGAVPARRCARARGTCADRPRAEPRGRHGRARRARARRGRLRRRVRRVLPFRPTAARAHGDARACRRRALRARSRRRSRRARRGRLWPSSMRLAARGRLTPLDAPPPRLADAQRGRLRGVGRTVRTARRQGVSLPCIACEPLEPRPREPRSRRSAARRLARLHVAPRRRSVCGARAGAERRCRVAVVGAATAEAAQAKLGRVDLVGAAARPPGSPPRSSATATARHPRVLLALAENAGDALERTLQAAGAECTRCNVYRTVPAPPRRARQPVVGAACG